MIRVLAVDVSRLEQDQYEAFYRLATPERKLRANRFRRQEDASRCIVADALLRYALGTQAYQVETAPGGKPRILGHSDFHFNLSHAGNWVVLAWGQTPVGVDVERHDRTTGYEAIAKRFFSPEEQRKLAESQDPSHKFYEIWTGKESYLKYLGTGLQYDLGSFSVYSLELPVHLHRPVLSQGYSLCLCTREEDYLLELLPVERLS